MGRDDSGSRLRPQARLAAQPSCELKLLLGPDALAEGLLLSGLLLLTLEGVHGVTFRLGTGERGRERQGEWPSSRLPARPWPLLRPQAMSVPPRPGLSRGQPERQGSGDQHLWGSGDGMLWLV